ncbi:MAG TPA: response regulator [Candidatus Acidoferrales bacterium]|nr:response regulator [Candidatus Acidoferrales bacterium]
MAVKVLIADTSRVTRDIIRHHLECGGCQVVAETENVAQTLDLFRTTQPHVVTLDAGLRGAAELDALALFRLIRRESPATSVVMVNPTGSTIYHGQFLREGALESVVEPFDSSGFKRMWTRLAAIYPELKRGN